MSTPYLLESVDRALRVLDCFTPTTPELRLTDISQRLGIHKVQALRLASTLETAGYLIRDPETKRFRLGIRLFQLGMLVQERMDLRRIAHPHLVELVAKTEETARLVLPDQDGPVCVDLVESPRGLRVSGQLGVRLPWHASASPKLILAYLPEQERERILSHGPFTRFTNRTVTDPDKLRTQLSDIRARGYHVSRSELDEHAVGVSAPIFDHRDQIAGSLNVTGPASRLGDQEVIRLIDLLTTAASSISHHLGHLPAARTA